MIAWLLVPAAGCCPLRRPAGCGWRSASTISPVPWRGLQSAGGGCHRSTSSSSSSGFQRVSPASGGRPRASAPCWPGRSARWASGRGRTSPLRWTPAAPSRRADRSSRHRCHGRRPAAGSGRGGGFARGDSPPTASRPGALAAGAVGAPSRPPVRRSGRCPVAARWRRWWSPSPVVREDDDQGVPRSLLSTRFNTVATPASFNNAMGLAGTINEQLSPGVEVFVAEMGTYGPGEIADLVSWVRPRVAVITAIGPSISSGSARSRPPPGRSRRSSPPPMWPSSTSTTPVSPSWQGIRWPVVRCSSSRQRRRCDGARRRRHLHRPQPSCHRRPLFALRGEPGLCGRCRRSPWGCRPKRSGRRRRAGRSRSSSYRGGLARRCPR